MRKVKGLVKVRMNHPMNRDRIVLNHEEFAAFRTYCKDHQISSSDFLDVMRFLGIQVVRTLGTQKMRAVSR